MDQPRFQLILTCKNSYRLYSKILMASALRSSKHSSQLRKVAFILFTVHKKQWTITFPRRSSFHRNNSNLVELRWSLKEKRKEKRCSVFGPLVVRINVFFVPDVAQHLNKALKVMGLLKLAFQSSFRAKYNASLVNGKITNQDSEEGEVLKKNVLDPAEEHKVLEIEGSVEIYRATIRNKIRTQIVKEVKSGLHVHRSRAKEQLCTEVVNDVKLQRQLAPRSAPPMLSRRTIAQRARREREHLSSSSTSHGMQLSSKDIRIHLSLTVTPNRKTLSRRVRSYREKMACLPSSTLIKHGCVPPITDQDHC
ncbi:hypothetical protein IFM89_005885 [Coptis chinensis]|uniref:Uncharacterized protein n=1 Tax=Coptis chinensis TaxID=261450 RepID=A0A835HIX4_9MAGN|nr:hypothetical protein IFM89_005885 [Coptis chinensis]